MEQFVIEGRQRLSGEITASGNKNAALKLTAACLLTEEPVTLRNVPNIADVRVMCDLIRSLGPSVERQSEGVVRIHAKNITTHRADPQLAQKIRASIVLAGPALAPFGPSELTT